MTVQAWILMTPSEKNAATALDDADAMLGAREIANPLANNLGFGVIVGKWVAPARLLNDPLYARWVPSLGALPIHVLDSETIFNPDPEV
ncbi:hypothetical protein ATU3C_12615 [Agrobacterium genomosp. 3 str. RTP8]|uniref:hypothetical protein n=1 Tax=Agrobacterium tomkonis TaxID=1183410 RepID=UPI001CD96ADA|nr:hypothetical protein [Agrobacterium tomkonis RTP8]